MSEIDIKQLLDGETPFYPQTDIHGLVNNGEYAIDDVPTIDSSNLVTSGGVASELALGAVYDVTAHNGSAQFASLQALLTDPNLNTLIPTNIRRGGMSIKFVQSSDNKYVQYMLMLSTFTAAQFINTSNWQGVDDEPTESSQNLVKSGGVYKMAGGLGVEINQMSLSLSDNTLINGYMDTSKVFHSGTSWRTTKPFYCNKDTLIEVYGQAKATVAAIAKVDENLTVIEDVILAGDGTTKTRVCLVLEAGYYAASVNGSTIDVHIITSDRYLKSLVANIRGSIDTLAINISEEINTLVMPSNKVTDPNTGEKVEDTIDSIGVHYSKLNPTFQQRYIKQNRDISNINSAFLMNDTPFYCNKGTLIRTTCKANNTMCVIAKTDESLTSPVEKVCVLGAGANQVLTYTYLVEESGYYACSGNRSGGLVIELITSDNYIKAITDDIYKTINLLPAPNTADFSLTDWQTKTYLCYLFHNPVFCGASTYEGHIVSNSDETQFSKVLGDYSMPSAIGRILSGWNVSNVSKAAITIKNWINTYFNQADFASHDLAFMGFGWNEQTPSTTIDEDVNQWEGDYTKYADTIYGNYCKLVEMVKEVNPNIYIAFTMPLGLNRNNQAKVDAINIIAAKYNIPVIDLNDKTYMTIPISTRDYIHNTPIGYIKTAQFVVASFARICESRMIEIENTIYAANT